MSKLFYVTALAIFISGCTTAPNVAVKMFDEERAANEVATLYPESGKTISVLMHIDGKAPGGCFVTCSFSQPIQVIPGKHKTALSLFMSPLDKDSFPLISSEKIQEAKAGKLNSGLLLNRSEVEIEVAFEQGKSYQLMVGYKNREDLTPYIWWDETKKP